MGQNWGWGCAPFEEGELGPHLTQCGLGRGPEAYLGAKFHLHPSNRLATIDTGQLKNWGCCAPFSWDERGFPGPTLTSVPTGRWPTSIPSGIIDPSSRLDTTNIWAKDWGWGCAPFGEGELGPHLTQCGLGRGLPPCQVSSWSIQLFGHNRHGPIKKIGGDVPLFLGGARLPSNTMSPGPTRTSVPTAILVHPAGGLKLNRHGPNIGCCAPFVEGELCPHLTHVAWASGPKPSSMLSFILNSWSIQPTGHNTPTLQTEHGYKIILSYNHETDRQDQWLGIIEFLSLWTGQTLTYNGPVKSTFTGPKTSKSSLNNLIKFNTACRLPGDCHHPPAKRLSGVIKS